MKEYLIISGTGRLLTNPVKIFLNL